MRIEFENRYCHQCKITTKHHFKTNTWTCLKCGTVKYMIYPPPKKTEIP